MIFSCLTVFIQNGNKDFDEGVLTAFQGLIEVSKQRVSNKFSCSIKSLVGA